MPVLKVVNFTGNNVDEPMIERRLRQMRNYQKKGKSFRRYICLCCSLFVIVCEIGAITTQQAIYDWGEKAMEYRCEVDGELYS